jgi:hypothetical protein
MTVRPGPVRLAAAAAFVVAAGCATVPPVPGPPLAEFCLEAQRVVVRTAVKPALVLHEDFDAFVKSKAGIEPLTIQQYVWYEDDDRSRPVMVSCKLKSADHLNETFGAGTSAGDGTCQDMNRLTWDRVQAALGPARVAPLAFDPAELVRNEANPGMTGPDWLKPYVLVSRNDAGVLELHSKGFRVDWTDPRFQAMPARFRGVQYCHLVAPEYLVRIVTGQAAPGLSVGREVVNPGPPPDMPPLPAPAGN